MRGGSTQPTNRQPVGNGQPLASEAALAAWEIQAHRTLASHPDPADLVRVARVQALIATTTGVVSEAAARRGEIDAGVIERVALALENAQLAWSRSARRWAELTTPASRTDPALVEAASELRAAIARGSRQPDQLGDPRSDRRPDRSACDRHDPSPQHGCRRRAGLHHP